MGSSGQRLLDIGSGTGTLARGFAARDAHVLALDKAAPLLAAARRLAQDWKRLPRPPGDEVAGYRTAPDKSG